MSEAFDVGKSNKAFDRSRSLVAVIESSQGSWLVGGTVPGLQRRPLEKLEPAKQRLLELLVRWLRAQGIEAYVIDAASVAVSRVHRRPKTDRLDTELLKPAFLGWLRGEPGSLQHGDDPQLRGGGRQAPEPRA